MTDLPELPEPLVGMDVNVSFYQKIEIDRRLLGHPAFLDVSDSGFRALVNLVVAAWFEVPAGSLLMHQKGLTKAAGFGEDTVAWARLELECLEHWVLCRDQRIYFPPMIPAVMDAFERRASSTASSTNAKAKERLIAELRNAGVMLSATQWRDRIDDVLAEWVKRRGKGLRGVQRRDLLLRMASDLELFPKEMPGPDLRLPSDMVRIGRKV